SNSETNRIEETASWVWNYFEILQSTSEYKKQGSCLIEVDDRNSSNSKRICGQIIRTQGSTRNFATHLGSYEVTKGTNSTNSQNLTQSLSFIHLLKVLDPYYDLPSDKQIKLRINEGYNLASAHLKEILKNKVRF
ncbi:11591_t:CDS:2, partial [Dentiscutata erythropus]